MLVFSINVRFPDDLHARIAAAAKEDRRSVNAEILWLIETALDTRPDRHSSPGLKARASRRTPR